MILFKRLKDYCENSTIHGLKYLTENGRHFIERLFWLIAVCASTAGMCILASDAWINFITHPATFVTDTNYLTWNTSFPAVTICERADASDRVLQYMEKNQIDKSNFLYINTVANWPDDCMPCKSCQRDADLDCPESDDKMINETRGTCTQIFHECFWNGEQFDCCSNFMPIMTEMGPCFTINSQLARPKPLDSKLVKLISNRKTGPGIMKLFLSDPIDVYLHGSEEVPYRNHPKDLVLEIDTVAMTSAVLFKLMEIENDPELRGLTVERRGCRFSDEPLPDSTYSVYSYSTCIVECRMKMQLELCNCTTVFMPRWEDTPLCAPQQLFCLFDNYKALRLIKQPVKGAEGLDCNCSLGCSELEITKIWSTVDENPNPESDIELEIKMASLPSERFQRNTVTSKLDLVVSLGGIAGLFLGASLLSGVEVFIYMLIRSCTNHCQTSNKVTRISAIRTYRTQ